MFITSADPALAAQLWQRLRCVMARASVVVGALPALAVLAAITRRRHREIASCIAFCETIVRKLILVAAAELRRAEAAQRARVPHIELVLQPLLTASARTARATGAHVFDATQPETWRVRFKLAPPRDAFACPPGRAPRIRALWGPAPAPPQHANVRPHHVAPAPLRLALRFEALHRVIADPAPHARRLARLLPRLCRRFSHAAERYAIAVARPYRSDERDPRLIVEAIAIALRAAPVFFNSG